MGFARFQHTATPRTLLDDLQHNIAFEVSMVETVPALSMSVNW